MGQRLAMDDADHFFHNLEVIRKLRGLADLQELAARSGVSRRTIYNTQDPTYAISLHRAQKLASALDVPLAILTGPKLPDNSTVLPADEISEILATFTDKEAKSLLVAFSTLPSETRRALLDVFEALLDKSSSNS